MPKDVLNVDFTKQVLWHVFSLEVSKPFCDEFTNKKESLYIQ
jgi:hypothetical protein